ncbi:OLC1v1018668C1 [Oldenlandia corymbosa var. corymbosa]|uniref:OLC1v1018668C1 n=1 Tax=Oldenlandia corymbosa var. corymbosa TaxID=529605 RepID=A0AAV1ECI4_OLDCO|nr:OLC1v1018668C1 [Oldenlandia corymbosa var. corymbosa]
MGKRSTFDDSDEEEPSLEKRQQEAPQPIVGQAPASQLTRAHAEGSRKRTLSVQAAAHQKRKRGTPEVVEVDPLSYSLPSIHEMCSVDELLKEGYEDQGQEAGHFESIPKGHALLTLDPPRVECADVPTSDMPQLEDGMKQAIGSFVTVCMNLVRQLASARRKASTKTSKARDAEARLQVLVEEKRRLKEDLSTMKGQLEGEAAAHNLQIENLRATTIPKSDLDKYILAGVQRYLVSSEFALGINDVMDPAMETGARKVVLEIEAARRNDEDIQPILDKYADRVMKGRTSAVRLRCKARNRDMNFVLLPVMQQITKACPSVSKLEDIDGIPGSPSFVFQMPRGIQTPPGTPPGPDEEPEAGKDVASGLPNPLEGTSEDVPATPGKWETSGIPWIDLQLPDPHFDATAFPLYAAVGGALVDPPPDRSRGRLSGLEGQLGEALEAYRASELCEARRAVIEAKSENDRLDKFWRDTEAYWEGRLKNSIQFEMLANNRLWKFEAKIRKKKKDDGLPEPDPEDFIPRNYFESVLVHLRKAYPLVAVRWDRSSDKIESLQAYAGQLRTALESAIFFIVETGKEYDFGAPDPCPAMRDDPASPTREAERLIYENDALFHELGQGSQ